MKVQLVLTLVQPSYVFTLCEISMSHSIYMTLITGCVIVVRFQPGPSSENWGIA